MLQIPQMNGKKIAVFGLGKSGQATLRCLLESGAIIYAYDDKVSSVEDTESYLGSTLFLQKPDTWPWAEIAVLVLSPGIPLYFPKPHPVVEQARKVGAKIICDIELLYLSQSHAIYVGISGTNGKSTTTSLIQHIFKQASLPSQIGGNIGIGVLELEPAVDQGVYVLELSSFQLDLVEKLHLNISVLLNITPDHIDRHGTMENYIESKKYLFRHQGKSDCAVIGVDDPLTNNIYETLKSENKIGAVIPISGRHRQPGGVAAIGQLLFDDRDVHNPKQLLLNDIRHLQGEHNAQNIAASYAAAKYMKIADDIIFSAIPSFVGLDHRMQFIAQIGQVKFYNDSKATNADATEKALTISDHIYWILGGQSKAGGITGLESYFPRIAHAYLIGQAQEEFAQTLEGKVPYSKCDILEKAVLQAAHDAKISGHKDAVVLLSPACASWDQFPNYEVRGQLFCKIIKEQL